MQKLNAAFPNGEARFVWGELKCMADSRICRTNWVLCSRISKLWN